MKTLNIRIAGPTSDYSNTPFVYDDTGLTLVTLTVNLFPLHRSNSRFLLSYHWNGLHTIVYCIPPDSDQRLHNILT